MSLPRRIIRRKKRRCMRLEPSDPYNSSTYEKEGFSNYPQTNVDYIFIGQCNSGDQISDRCADMHLGFNYSEVVNATQKLVGKTLYKTDNSSCESPKESEIESIENTSSSSQNDIDVIRNWDNYQDMYSEEGGDSHIDEKDYIREWEPEEGTDVMNDSFNFMNPEKKISIMTSGYETSPDHDSSLCVRSLFCILQYTLNCYSDVVQKQQGVPTQADGLTESSYQSLVDAITQYRTVAQMHLQLIHEILYKEPCFVTKDIQLFDDFVAMERKWSDVFDNSLTDYINVTEILIQSLDNYGSLVELQRVIQWLEKISSVLIDLEIMRERSHNDPESQSIQIMRERVDSTRHMRATERDILLCAQACIKDSKYTRGICEHDIDLLTAYDDRDHVPPKDILIECDEYISKLSVHRRKVELITPSTFQGVISLEILQEISSWGELRGCPIQCLSAKIAQPSIKRLPLCLGIILGVAFLFWWFSFSSADGCQSPSSKSWISYIYRNRSRLEPH